MPVEVRLSPSSDAELERELEANLRHGRAFVPVVVDVELLSDVVLVVVRPLDRSTFTVNARVVMKLEAGAMIGTALELVGEGADAEERLRAFVRGEGVASVLADVDAEDLPDLGEPLPGDSGEHDAVGEEPEEEREAGEAQGPMARLRKLSTVERMKLARDGHLEERVLLERLFGKAVWEDLLRNPQITVPEIARIAGKGTVPRVMLEQIVDNPAWGRQSIVRRALLGNPRVSADGILKLLRMTPKNELKLIAQTTAYPAAVRGAARKLLDD